MVLETLFGETLLKQDGTTEVETSELSTEPGAVVGVYFSAHWCPPCRHFTPELVKIYDEIKAADQDFEVVFVSWDHSDAEYKSYLADMPWLAVPHDQDDVKKNLGEKFDVNGIPSLILLDGATGETLSATGRAVVSEHGASGYPFTEARIAECKLEKMDKLANGMIEMNWMSYFDKLCKCESYGYFNDITTTAVESFAKSSEAMAIAFLRGQGCQGSSFVAPKLGTVKKSLGDRFGVMAVPMEDINHFSREQTEKLVEIPMVKFGEKSEEIVAKFTELLGEIEAPHVFVFKVNEDSSLTILNKEAARDVYFLGEEGFPWSEEAKKAAKEREEQRKAEEKAKLKDFEIFRASDTCHVVDKDGVEVEPEFFMKTEVVGIYFSAHWCGPCRSFTPKLAEVYNKCKEKGKSFEIVFASSDQDQEAFDDYYKEMPWCALAYDDRKLKESLSNIFEVRGIPTLILLNGAGDVITEDGREAVEYGEEFFPWGKAELEKGKKALEKKENEALEKAKEAESDVYKQQEEANKIVIKRHRGNQVDTTISVDHVVKFGSFSTIAAPSAVVPAGKKAFYEVTFKEGSGISQIGWVTADFKSQEGYSGDGVGDCTNGYGFDGQRKVKWHGGDTAWGKKFEPNEDKVLGVALDMENGKMLFGLDGDWSEPMGLAFEGVNKELEFHPACTGNNMTLFINFGYSDFKHGPPDESFEKLVDVVIQS